jgi:hypothetical protein
MPFEEPPPMSRMFEYHSAADHLLSVVVALLIGMFVLVYFVQPG